MKVAKRIIGLAMLVMTQLAFGQNPPSALSIGENTKLNAGGMLTFGYAGDYGDQTPSSHGLTWGLNGAMSGYYYNPNFINFTAAPYYNQSRNDSDSQSLTGASGINTTANFFSGSNFPGSVSYHFDRNSTGTFGLAGQPNFTTIGDSQGFSVNWSALLPNWPTLAVGYSQGEGSGNIYGTDESTNSSTKLFNAHSTYELAGFHLTALYTHLNSNSFIPEFLSGQQETETQDSSGQTFGVGAIHNLPLSGTFYANYSHSSNDTNFDEGNGGPIGSNYSTSQENSGVTFHPTKKFSFSVNETYIGDLSGYLSQSLNTNNGTVPVVNLGEGSHSLTVGGGMGYQITQNLGSSVQATRYDQFYSGESYSGTFVSGTLTYGKRLLNMFTFSGSVIDSSIDYAQNSLGFVGNVNYFRRIKGWDTSGQFSYAQNVQTVLVSYTTSYYNYSASIHRRFGEGGHWHWSGSFGGSRSGLSDTPGASNHSESYSSSFGNRRFTLQGNYSGAAGTSILGPNGLQGVPPTPGLTDFVQFNGTSYGGGLSGTPLRRLILSATYNRAMSNTYAQVLSHNDTQVYTAQLQYHLRRIGLQAGYTRFTQGISAVGTTPASTTAYFVGFSRWFDLF